MTLDWSGLKGGTRFDLHMHSDRSDGRFPIDEVLARCSRSGLDVIALTDHDIVGPLETGDHPIEGRTVRVIAAAEVTGHHDGQELHLLVYFPGPVPAGFQAFCRAQVSERARRYEALRAKLPFEDLPEAPSEAHEGELALTRLHLARSLVAKGAAKDVQQAFSKYLGKDVPDLGAPFEEAIRIALSFGGVPVWAHPTRAQAQKWLTPLAKAGLRGVEALRAHQDNKERWALRRMAKDQGCFITGGSDWHGWGDANLLGLFSVQKVDLDGFLAAMAA